MLFAKTFLEYWAVRKALRTARRSEAVSEKIIQASKECEAQYPAGCGCQVQGDRSHLEHDKLLGNPFYKDLSFIEPNVAMRTDEQDSEIRLRHEPDYATLDAKVHDMVEQCKAEEAEPTPLCAGYQGEAAYDGGVQFACFTPVENFPTGFETGEEEADQFCTKELQLRPLC